MTNDLNLLIKEYEKREWARDILLSLTDNEKSKCFDLILEEILKAGNYYLSSGIKPTKSPNYSPSTIKEIINLIVFSINHYRSIDV